MLNLLEQYAATGQASMLHLMMLAGVNPNIKGRDGKTIAHHAAMYAVATGDASAIRKIADYGGAMDEKDSRGVSPMDILKAKPALFDEVRIAVLKGIGNSGVKDSSTVNGDFSLSEKAKRQRGVLRKLRGGRILARPDGKEKTVETKELEKDKELLDTEGGLAISPVKY